MGEARAQRIAVIGAGAWGTTLGALAAANGHAVTLLGRDAAAMAMFQASHENTHYLPGHPLPPSLRFTADAGEAFHAADLVMLAVPSAEVCRVIAQHEAALKVAEVPLLSTVKGFTDDQLTRVSRAIESLLPGYPLAVLSGPNLAKEVLEGHPTVTVIASEDEAIIARFQAVLARHTFRIYGSQDMVGVELAGAVKNILAIGTGIAEALEFGMNTRAALLSRGLAEMAVLGQHFGAERETLTGIAGMGDAICTCLSRLSRNVQLGLLLGCGLSLEDAQTQVTGVTEGVWTALHVDAYARANGLDLPITAGVAAVVTRRATPGEVVEQLMAREWKMELA